MTSEDEILYTPELGDNRDLDAEEQIYCSLLPMTGEEIRAYQRVMVGVKPSSPQAMRKAESVIRRIVTERVIEIHNYTDIRGEPITNGADLFERGEPAMVDEIYEALSSISKLKRGQRKN